MMHGARWRGVEMEAQVCGRAPCAPPTPNVGTARRCVERRGVRVHLGERKFAHAHRRHRMQALQRGRHDGDPGLDPTTIVETPEVFSRAGLRHGGVPGARLAPRADASDASSVDAHRRVAKFAAALDMGSHFCAATRRLVKSALSMALRGPTCSACRVRMRRLRRCGQAPRGCAAREGARGERSAEVSEERCKRLPDVVLNTPRLRLSYPNGSPGSYPDAPLLASLCEGAGLDLRLVILMREAD